MCTLCLVVALLPTVMVGAGPGMEIERNIGVQTRIHQTATAGGTLTRAEAFAAYENLRDIITKSPEEFIRQLLVYMSNPRNSADQQMYALLAIDHFKLPDHMLIATVAPVAYSDDKQVAEVTASPRHGPTRLEDRTGP